MSKLKHTVRWYQSILKVTVGYTDVPINGNHNDRSTKAALRDFQQARGLKATGFLTVSSNLGLTQIALEWIYQRPMDNIVGKKSMTLQNRILEFQRDYGLETDGKVGPLTMGKMMDVLLENFPLPYKPPNPKLARKAYLRPEPCLQGEILETDIVLGENTK